MFIILHPLFAQNHVDKENIEHTIEQHFPGTNYKHITIAFGLN